MPSFGSAFYLCGATNIHGNLLPIGKSPGNTLGANTGDIWEMSHCKSQNLWFFSQKPALAVHALGQGIISYSFAEWVQ